MTRNVRSKYGCKYIYSLAAVVTFSALQSNQNLELLGSNIKKEHQAKHKLVFTEYT